MLRCASGKQTSEMPAVQSAVCARAGRFALVDGINCHGAVIMKRVPSFETAVRIGVVEHAL